MLLCASAAISKAWRINFRSPGLMRAFKPRKSARYSRKISFFSCSAFRLYFGVSATVSMAYEYTLFTQAAEGALLSITAFLQMYSCPLIKKLEPDNLFQMPMPTTQSRQEMLQLF